MTSAIVRVAHLCAVASLTLAPIAVAAKSASSLGDLVGARASGGESDLESRGWTMITGHRGGNANYNYWWNRDRKDCVMVTTRDGRYASITDASAGDCHQKSGGNDAAKVAAIAGGAALLAALLSHKSGHHENGQHDDDSQKEADYERGYRDGLHNSSWRNDSRSESYGTGYQAGVDQRQRELDQGNGNGGNSYGAGGFGNSSYGNSVNAVDVSDLVGSKAAGVETDLKSRGFRNVDGFQSGSSGKGTIWWNGHTRQCLQMITANGRADSIEDIQTHARCR